VTPASRAAFVACVCILIGAGLLIRLAPLGLPVVVIRHLGNAIWGAMVLCLIVAIRPARVGLPGCLVAAIAMAIGSELFRLYHAPALDAFRHTLAGALLIGRVFSLWNMLDYLAGIIIASLAIAITRRFGPDHVGTWG
jgi:hypothetical protein